MITTKPQEYEVTSTFNSNVLDIHAPLGEIEAALVEARDKQESVSIEMSINQNALHNVMAILTNLYHDDVMAVLREYATNALDSHIEAGIDAPIEVTLPSNLSPTLVIRDHGIGLSPQDIANIYSQYATSTKTDTNDLTGSLGLGCKSALAYTQGFSLQGIKDGLKTLVSVSLDEDGIGAMELVEQVETDEPNGVAITIPCKKSDIWAFADRAQKLFRFWPEGAVLVNGAEPLKLVAGLKISDDIKLIKGSDQLGHSYVVMGNIPYPIDRDQFNFGLERGYHLVARIANGSVHFQPSREGLRYTPTTKRVLQQLSDDFQTALHKSIKAEIDAAKTKAKALSIVAYWRTALPRAMRDNVFLYQGLELPTEIRLAGTTFLVSDGQPQKDYYGKSIKVGKHSKYQVIEAMMVPEAIWVDGFDRTFTPAAKKKLWMWCDERNRAYPSHFICVPKLTDSTWIEPSNIVQWAEVDKLKLPRFDKRTGKSVSGRIRGSYDLYYGVDLMTEIEADEIDDSMPIYYYVGDTSAAWSLVQRLDHYEEDFTVVVMRSNRVAKFVRSFPEARQLHEVLDEHFAYWWSTLSEYERDMVRFTTNFSTFAHLPQTIADPALARVVRMYTIDNDWRKRVSKRHSILSLAIRREEIDNPLDKYPLVSQYFYGSDSRRISRHNRIYIDAVYAAEEANHG